MLACLPALAAAQDKAGAAPAAEPPSPAEQATRARLADELLPAAPASDEAFAASLKAAKAAGMSEHRVLEAEVYRALMHRVKSSDCLALAARLEKSAAAWNAQESVLVDGPALATALAHALRALHAARSGDDAKYREESARAVWGATRLADLLADIEASRRKETLLATPAFVELTRAVQAVDEAAAKKVFEKAYWADAPLSCDLAAQKLDALRDAREAARSEKADEAPPRGVAAFVPAGRPGVRRGPWDASSGLVARPGA